MEKPIAKIRDWTVIGGHLYGKVSNHPNKNITDDTFVKTSKALRIETEGTIYELGNWVPSLSMGSSDKVCLKNVD